MTRYPGPVPFPAEPGFVAPEQAVAVTASAAVQTSDAMALGMRKENHPFTGVVTGAGGWSEYWCGNVPAQGFAGTILPRS